MSLALTSSAFRLILSDLFLSARRFVSGIAQGIKSTAQTVEGVADAVNERVKTTPEPMSFGIAANIAEKPPTSGVDKPTSTPDVIDIKSPKELVLERLELVSSLSTSFAIFVDLHRRL